MTPVRRERFELRAASGRPIRGEVLHPETARGSVLLCHGFKGFYRWGFFPYLAERLAAAGLCAIAFNFSGSGVGADRESFTDADAFFHATIGGDLADVASVVVHGREAGWIAERYGVMGHSRGGAVAILHASRAADVAALVTWSAIATIVRWSPQEIARWREDGYLDVPNARTGQVLRVGTGLLREIDEAASGALSIERAAHQIHVPWLIVHGTADESVEAEDAYRLARAAHATDVQLELIDGAGHTFDIQHPMSSPSSALERAASITTTFLRDALG
ncbi:MAG TPA: alpha/beta fold hydrolase [Gemmatimonadaceae bacterium]|nr:alpha/beta fold hydrolase [Gemmatimonadaceae bacterium]